MTSGDIIDSYESAVLSLILSDSDRLISNDKSEHAAILYKYFFKFAQEHVLIFCKNLSSIVFDDPKVIENAKEALGRGLTVKIITQDDPQSAKFVALIQEKSRIFPQNVWIRKLQNDQIKINFAISDNKRYRYEQDHGMHKAVACMNDIKFVEILENLFGKIEAISNDMVIKLGNAS